MQAGLSIEKASSSRSQSFQSLPQTSQSRSPVSLHSPIRNHHSNLYSHVETHSNSLRDQSPGPPPLSPLPMIPSPNSMNFPNPDENGSDFRSQGWFNGRPLNQTNNQGLNGSHRSTSSSGGSSLGQVTQQQPRDLLMKRAMGVQNSLIDPYGDDMKRPSSSTISSLGTVFRFNETSPNTEGLQSNHPKYLPVNQESNLPSQLSSKPKSKSSKFLPTLGLTRRSSIHIEDNSGDTRSTSSRSVSDTSVKQITSNGNGGMEKETRNGFSRKHNRVVVKDDDVPIAKFKQGPGRGRVYIAPPEKRKKNKD